MFEIIPAILTDSSIKFKELVRKLEPYTSRIHIDIADGEFVPNKTVTGYNELREIEAAVKFDIHLMVEKPEKYLKEWLHTRADRFIIHAELKSDLRSLIGELHKNGRKVGLAFNPETDLGKFAELISKVDFVQFMTVHPGFQGRQFVNEVVDKIRTFHKENPDIIIMSDGSTTPVTAPQLVEAGVSVLVSGSYIIKNQSFEKAIQQLKETASKF